MRQRQILDCNSLHSLEKLTTVSTITTMPLAFWAAKTPVIVTKQLETLEFVENTENLDDITHVGKYTVTVDGKVVFIVDSSAITNQCEAQDYITGLVVEYDTVSLAYNTSNASPIYNLLVLRRSDGRFVTMYKQMGLAELMKVIPTLDSALDVNVTGGYIYQITRDITTWKK